MQCRKTLPRCRPPPLAFRGAFKGGPTLGLERSSSSEGLATAPSKSSKPQFPRHLSQLPRGDQLRKARDNIRGTTGFGCVRGLGASGENLRQLAPSFCIQRKLAKSVFELSVAGPRGENPSEHSVHGVMKKRKHLEAFWT